METYYPVNYNKSIQKQRLIYILSTRIIWSYIICYISAAVAFVMLLGIFVNYFAYQPTDPSYYPAIIPLLGLIALCWMIANLVLMNAFVKVDGKDKEANRKNMIAILHQYYKLNNLDIADENMIRDIKPYEFVINGRMFTCLMDNEIVYLNITTVQNFHNLSPFNGLYNYYKCKRLAKEFKRLKSENKE